MALIEDNEREPCDRHFRPEAIDKKERLAAMKAALLLLGWVEDRSAGLVLEPSVFESGCVHGRRNWTKLVMMAGARDGLSDRGSSSLQMDLTGGKTCNGKYCLATVQNVDRLSMMLLTIQMAPMCNIPACAIGAPSRPDVSTVRTLQTPTANNLLLSIPNIEVKRDIFIEVKKFSDDRYDCPPLPPCHLWPRA